MTAARFFRAIMKFRRQRQASNYRVIPHWHRSTALFPALLFAVLVRAQQSPEVADATASVSVHGIVVNSVSGEPLPRALVKLAGDTNVGALTDGEGRYELRDVPIGPQQLMITKPGFLDATAEAESSGGNMVRDYAHTVMVAAGMQDVTFRMEPMNAIHGRVQLSTGDRAGEIEIMLVRQIVVSGRFAWQTMATTRTNADGTYRFHSLPDGVYAVCSAPAMETGTEELHVDLRHEARERAGYASQFYPDARDFGGAARIALKEGEQAEANLSLALETFHAVTAKVFGPNDATGQEFSPDRQGTTTSAVVMDSQGHALLYSAQYDQATHTIQALLPDGNYTLIAMAGRPFPFSRRRVNGGPARDTGVYTGSVEFSLNGHAVTNLRIGLASAATSVVQLSLARSGESSANSANQNADVHEMVLTISEAGGSAAYGIVSTFAVGSLAGPVNTMVKSPGSYWVHTNLEDKHYCADSLMAEGSNLGREPLTIGVSGSSVPLMLSLRDDCAKLALTLAATAGGSGVGEEPFYTVYVVPDFDSTEDVVPQTLRPSTGGRVTLTGLTPGNYHVYVFDQPIALAYREKAVMNVLSNRGQTIDLAPGQAASLTIEAPRP